MDEMQTHKIDRTGWPNGEWDAEPDRMQWQHGKIPCLIVRNSLGNLCGYAGVSRTHPFYRSDYDNVEVCVHGGLTYGDTCQLGGPICHEPEPGQPADVWWLGFDCAHLGDYVPGMHRTEIEEALAASRAFIAQHVPGMKAYIYTRPQEPYRDINYVQGEVNRLADQLADAASFPRCLREYFNRWVGFWMTEAKA
jgi:hypothetical protein